MRGSLGGGVRAVNQGGRAMTGTKLFSRGRQPLGNMLRNRALGAMAWPILGQSGFNVFPGMGGYGGQGVEGAGGDWDGFDWGGEDSGRSLSESQTGADAVSNIR